jgi:hypothetical protein
MDFSILKGDALTLVSVGLVKSAEGIYRMSKNLKMELLIRIINSNHHQKSFSSITL